jgi:hypothetical protein
VPPSASVAVAVHKSVVADVTPVAGEIVTTDRTGVVLSTVTEWERVPVSPWMSVAVAVHVTMSPGETVVGVRVREVLDPSAVPDALVHTYARVGVPPSGSFAVAEQSSVEDVVIPVAGRMVTVVTMGEALSTVTETDPVSVAPCTSVAVIVQVTVSPGDTMDGESASDVPKPNEIPEPSVQA